MLDSVLRMWTGVRVASVLCPPMIVVACVLGLAPNTAAAQGCVEGWVPQETFPGSGMNNAVNSLAVLPNGDLIAGGTFTTAGGVTANRIARWNGSAWTPLGPGLNNNVRCLAVLPNGDLVAGGDFTSIGGVAANRIARWNGSAWTSLGSGMNSDVRSLVVLSNGDLIAGGDFTTADNVTANYIARWNGSAWNPLGPGIDQTTGGAVNSLAVLFNGDLVAGGHFYTSGGVDTNYIARWNGSAWASVGSGVHGNVNSLAVLPNGDLIAVVSGVSVRPLARWNGSTWTELAGSAIGPGILRSIFSLAALPNGDLIAGGDFTSIGGVAANRIARWNGSAWAALGLGTNNSVACLAVLPNADLLVGGSFTTAGDVTANRIALYNIVIPPRITTQPLSTAACTGTSVSLTLAAAGDGPISYQWRQNGTPIDPLLNPSAQTATLIVNSVRSADSGIYDCLVTDACGSATSGPAELSICGGDLGCDGFVDDTDFVYFTQQYAVFDCGDPAMPDACSADLNADGFVDDTDFVFFSQAYEQFACP